MKNFKNELVINLLFLNLKIKLWENNDNNTIPPFVD
jgi:hypothetical protein